MDEFTLPRDGTCDACWMKEFKNWKHRSVACCSCELSYQIGQFYKELNEELKKFFTGGKG